MATEKIKIRGLAFIAAWLLGLWGALVASKGIYDLAGGTPEANLYAPGPWEFISKEQWLRYAGFELVYGLACLGLAWYLVRYAAFLPEIVQRGK